MNAEGNVTTALYLIGSATDGSLGWLSQRLDGGSGTEPIGVYTGNSGLADTSPAPWWAAGAVALLILATSAGRVRRTQLLTTRSIQRTG